MVEVGKMEALDTPEIEFEKCYPISTFITKELIPHCKALGMLFCETSHMMVHIRPTDSHKIFYVVGDALVEGFFIATQYPDCTITTQGGLWQELFAE